MLPSGRAGGGASEGALGPRRPLIRPAFHDSVAEGRLSIPPELHDGPAEAAVAKKLTGISPGAALVLDDGEYEIAAAVAMLCVLF